MSNLSSNEHLDFGIDVSINFAARILVFAIVSISSIFIARALGPAGKGIYTVILTILSIAAVLTDMGIGISNIYFIGKKRYPIGSIMGNMFFYAFCAGGLAALLLIVLTPFLGVLFLKGAPRIYLYITFPLIPFLLLFDNIQYIFLGYRDMFKLAIFGLIRPLSYLLILLFLNYFLKLSVAGVIGAYIFGLAAGISLEIYFLSKSGYCSALALNKQLFKETLNFGFKNQLGTIFQLLNYRFDMLLVSALLNPFEVGLYSIAVLIAETVWYIPLSLGQVLYSKTASCDSQTANRFTPIVCRNTVFLTLAAVLALYGICGIVIPWLFTPQFLRSVMALKLLLPGIFFLSIGKVLGHDLVGRGLPGYPAFAAFISLLLTVILDLWLIPRFGINGASVASSVSYTVYTVIILYLFKKLTGVRISNLMFFKFRDFTVYQKFFSPFLARKSLRDNL